MSDLQLNLFNFFSFKSDFNSLCLFKDYLPFLETIHILMNIHAAIYELQ